MNLSELPKGKLIGSVVFLVIAIGFAIWMMIPSSGKTPELTKAQQAQEQLTQQANDAGLTQPGEVIPPPSEPVSRRARKAQ